MSGKGSLPDDPGKRLEEVLAEHREEPADTADPARDHDPLDHDPLDPFAAPAEEMEQTEPDREDPLPEVPLFSLLRTVEDRVGVDRIDRIWIFPPRRLEVGETAVVVVSAFPDADDDRRRVLAAHYTAHHEAPEPHLALAEYGAAPTGRVTRLVEEVVERIKDGPAGAPRAVTIHGQAGRWHAMLNDLADQLLQQARKNPRLRP